ncbi:FitA-like ribbon-helix-helix domain-containing protein [Amycolatopsis alkalitolerans]|uniref:Arc family DNA-binding protein n=1 Tax=Amycolatopsis alkalitolerans TaxID=2547244 RepID=A0A5C4M3D4_9PSEU|nr:Arc family DNA-binding protein [Amycolatopsis alkalitolerans]TNC26403.1 Arc family DNA-binding protein [Amycolatopsis alkalitolerans]
MAAIHIRHVPEATLSALRERAARHGRSMQQELLDILELAAAEPVPVQAPPL